MDSTTWTHHSWRWCCRCRCRRVLPQKEQRPDSAVQVSEMSRQVPQQKKQSFPLLMFKESLGCQKAVAQARLSDPRQLEATGPDGQRAEGPLQGDRQADEASAANALTATRNGRRGPSNHRQSITEPNPLQAGAQKSSAFFCPLPNTLYSHCPLNRASSNRLPSK